jgi:hypothetical protein
MSVPEAPKIPKPPAPKRPAEPVQAVAGRQCLYCHCLTSGLSCHNCGAPAINRVA